jgi:hypothetical protein
MAIRRLLLVSVLFTGAVACTDAPSAPVVSDEDPLTSENGLTSNGLTSNGLTSNGLTSNGLTSNGLTSNGLTSNGLVMGALQDPSPTGTLTRLFFRYLISCALPATSSVTYTWTDTTGTLHTEINPGGIGLAPNWENGPASQNDKEIVSACLGARTNSLGVHVPLSLRAKGVSALNVTSQERASYTYGEGAFWGNLFNGSPYLYSCSRDAFDAGAATSQYLSQGRTCTTSACGIITPVGPCYTSNSATTGQACYEQNQDWTANCSPQKEKFIQGSQNVIATWLMP